MAAARWPLLLLLALLRFVTSSLMGRQSSGLACLPPGRRFSAPTSLPASSSCASAQAPKSIHLDMARPGPARDAGPLKAIYSSLIPASRITFASALGVGRDPGAELRRRSQDEDDAARLELRHAHPAR